MPSRATKNARLIAAATSDAAPAINYIPNDPDAAGAPIRGEAPLSDPAGAAKFDITPKPSSPNPGQFGRGTVDFQYWQTRQALIYGLNNWESLTGAYPAKWFGSQATLPIQNRAGDGLNAYYNRMRISFFFSTVKNQTFYVAESPDVVCHELGHALLDAVRSDYWTAGLLEVDAFHEAFADCMAILTSLRDPRVRDAVLASGLEQDNLVSCLAEESAAALGAQDKRLVDSVNPPILRRANNALVWSDPTTLPTDEYCDHLTSECHNFSRIFTGCFYDCIVNVCKQRAVASADDLLSSVTTVGKLLIEGVLSAKLGSAIYKEVGQRMLQADAHDNGGENTDAITRAFARHGITLGPPLQPLTVRLGGKQSPDSAIDLLRERLQVGDDVDFSFTSAASLLKKLSPDFPNVVNATGRVLEDVSDVDPSLAGVQVAVPVSVQLVTSRRNVIEGFVGEVGELKVIDDALRREEARAYARMLLDTHSLATDANAQPPGPWAGVTHKIDINDGVKVITRVGYRCPCRGAFNALPGPGRSW